jgi:hypothetical protein
MKPAELAQQVHTGRNGAGDREPIDVARLCSITGALAVLLEPNSVVELRSPNTNRQTVSGYFNDHKQLAQAAAGLSGTVPGVYVTPNPVRTDLLARAANRIVPYAKKTTGDSDILSRRWLLIDFDAVRPSGISATDVEHEAALERARLCMDWLLTQGWPEPILADSGNGGHLLYRLDLANEPANTELVKHCLQALGLRFTDCRVIVDLTTYNASRICKVYGTVAAKGDNTPDRPHRVAKLLDVPSRVEVVSPELLAQLAAMLPSDPQKQSTKGSFNLAAWISQYQIPVVSDAPWNGGHKWILNPCPWNPEHTNRSAFVVQLANGAIAAGCLHASCAGNDWAALRALFDSDEKAAGDGDSHQDGHSGRLHEQEKLTQVKRLLSLGSEARLFHTPSGDLFASIPVNGHVENWPLKSRKFRHWLLGRYYVETQGAPKNQALQEAIGIFESKANFEGPEHPVFTRLAERDGKIYIDLGNDAWDAVEIDSDGWRVISDVPVKFRRARGMASLPYPVRNGSGVNELRRFVNIASEQDWILLVAWLIAAFRPRGPYPVLVLHGEHGSAKSTAARLLRSLLDPNTAPLRGEPRDLRDVMIAANNAWILSYDNLSRIPGWLSDAFCRLATGGGFATRELYTDSGEMLFDAQRPIILNGIEELANRGDLLDRSLILYLPSIPEDKRAAESTFWADFEAARPTLLAALLDVLCGALDRLPNIVLHKKPRLADFAVWATAAEPLLGLAHGAFLTAYDENRSSATALALEASPIAVAIQTLADAGPFEGTATDLLRALTPHADEATRSQKSWPANGQTLSNALRRLVPSLRNCGIEIIFRKSPDRGRRRLIWVRNVASAASKASEAPDSSIIDRTVADVDTQVMDAGGCRAVRGTCTDSQDLSVTADGADDVDARMRKSEPVPVAIGTVGQSCHLGQKSGNSRIEGEL